MLARMLTLLRKEMNAFEAASSTVFSSYTRVNSRAKASLINHANFDETEDDG